jgi:hypothetical protein
MANNNDDIKNVLLALNQFTPADAVLTVDSETKNTDIVQEGIRVTKEGIEEAWDTLEAPKAKEATAEADTEVTEHNSGEDVTLTVNTPTEIKVPAEQADMIANMLKLAGVEVGDKPAMDQPDMDMDSGNGEDLPMVIPTDDEEAPLMGACASEGNEFSGKRQDAIDAGEDEFEVDGKTHKVKGDNGKTESEEVQEAKDKMVCKHCGDEIYKPKSDCECDCNDPKGDNWVKETYEMAEVEESIEKAWNENVTSEAIGQYADPLYDLIEELGSHQVVMDELIRYLDADQIKEFVSDFRRHHEMPADGPIDDDDPRYMDDENLPKEGVEMKKESDTALSTGNAIMYKGKEIDLRKLDYDMQDISDGMWEINAPVYYTDGTEVADGDYDGLYDLPELNDWIYQDYTSESIEESDIDQIADVGKVYSKINKMKMDLVDNGMEPEDAQDKACEKYDCDPAMYDKYVEMKRDEREQPMQEAFDKVDRITDMEELNLYDPAEIEAAKSMSAEQLKDELMGDIYHVMDKASDDFTDNDYIVDEMGDNFASMHLNADDATLSCYSAMRDLVDEDPADVLQTGQMCLKILGAQPYEANESKDNLDPQVNRIAELSGITTPVAQANPVAEAVSTTDLITKYQGSEVDVNDMNRLLKLSGMGELDESKLANAPAGTSMDEPTEFDKLPSEVGKGAGNSDYINRADGQGENPMGMHSSDVEESFNTALGEYRKFVAEGIMGKKTKKAKK